jgi:hypothetical protein
LIILSDLLKIKIIIKQCFLELSKAFDTVSHDIVIKRFGYYKFFSSSISMIISYLSNNA